MQFVQVLLGGNKGSGNKVHIVFDSEKNVRLILLGKIRTGHYLIGETHTLAVAQSTANNGATNSLVAFQCLNLKNHKTVIHQHPVAHIQISDKVLIVYRHDGLVALHLFRGKTEDIALFHHNLTVLKSTDSVFRALGIQHDSNGHTKLFANTLDQINLRLVFFVRTVGKIQSGHIHTRLTHLCQSLFVFTCRADGADNFCLTHRMTSFLLYEAALVSYCISR